MTKKQRLEYIAYLIDEIDRRKGLGGYSHDAPAIEQICRILLDILEEKK